jgi:6-phosphogluconolactonase
METAGLVAHEAAARIAETVRRAIGERGAATLALSGGSTPRDTYTLLAATNVDWSKVDVFWVDERAVPPTHDRSNFFMAYSALIGNARFDARRVWPMHADRADLSGAATDYERQIVSRVAPDDSGVPAIDAVVLGIGTDGHTASLFPGEPTVNLADSLVATVTAHGMREARLTFTSRLIEHALHVFVLVVGGEKREAVKRALASEGTVLETPARVIRECRGSVTWIVDREAAPPGQGI